MNTNRKQFSRGLRVGVPISLGYLAVEDLAEMIGTDQFCHACFSGEYPTPIPTNTQKDRFEGKLSQREKKKP